MQCTNGKLQVTVEADHSSHKRNQHVEKPQENFVRERLLGLLQSNIVAIIIPQCCYSAPSQTARKPASHCYVKSKALQVR